jgi:hypothetical protein
MNAGAGACSGLTLSLASRPAFHGGVASANGSKPSHHGLVLSCPCPQPTDSIQMRWIAARRTGRANPKPERILQVRFEPAGVPRGIHPLGRRATAREREAGTAGPPAGPLEGGNAKRVPPPSHSMRENPRLQEGCPRVLSRRSCMQCRLCPFLADSSEESYFGS